MDDKNEQKHRDVLSFLNENRSLKDKLVGAHGKLKETSPFIARIAVALYDTETRVLKTFLHSSGEDNPLNHYQALIDDAPSLKKILEQGLPRVINNLVTYETEESEHTRRIGRQGYAASYTLPIFNQGEFIGFIFFNSYERNVFTEKVLRELDLFGHLIALLVINEVSVVKTLSAALKTTSQLTHVRDPETGSHLDRMSRYARLIANALADEFELDDSYIEHVFMFAPLHDLGKIAIPDDILLKPGRLTEQETEVMRTHARKGREMIDQLIQNFGLEQLNHVDVLRNIAEYHHEAVNGSGYPDGRAGDEIPFEARIVAVADVFDALTSRRVYKAPWSIDEAFAVMREMAGEKLDSRCVEVLIAHREAVESIQTRFVEDGIG